MFTEFSPDTLKRPMLKRLLLALLVLLVIVAAVSFRQYQKQEQINKALQESVVNENGGSKESSADQIRKQLEGLSVSSKDIPAPSEEEIAKQLEELAKASEDTPAPTQEEIRAQLDELSQTETNN